MNALFSPHALTSHLTLKNRIVMAPMTRRQSSVDHTPSEAMIEYYARRSSAGLIITEGTIISLDAIGYGNVPGIFTEKHINAWRSVTDAVHQNHGYIPITPQDAIFNIPSDVEFSMFLNRKSSK